MRRIIFTCCIFSLLIISTNCSKDKQALTDSTWKVESLREHTDSVFLYPEYKGATNVLAFKKKEYYLGLDVNSVVGEVKFKQNNGIEFKPGLTTLVGGDSPFAKKFESIIFYKINRYMVSGNLLILTGNGATINLIKS